MNLFSIKDGNQVSDELESGIGRSPASFEENSLSSCKLVENIITVKIPLRLYICIYANILYTLEYSIYNVIYALYAN